MIALGFARAGAAAPPGLTAIEYGPVVLLAATEEVLPTPRARIASGLRCGDTLDAFLPFAPRKAVSVQAARSWADTRMDRLQSALEALCGKGQLSVELRHKKPVAPNLRARAAARTHAERTCARLVEALDPVAHRQQISRKGVQFHALIRRHPRCSPSQMMARLAPMEFGDWSIAASGLWPPFCFFDGPA